MKNVLLVHPEISRTKYNFVGIIENECLELEYISAILKQQGMQVTLFDKQVETGTMQEKLHEVTPDVVYVCGRSRQENFMKEYCRDAKQYNPAIMTIAGGLHVQHATQRMKEPAIDFLLTSFDVFLLVDIITAPQTAQSLPGVVYQKDGVFCENAPQPFDIKRLPRPDRGYFKAHPGHYQYLDLPHAAHVRTAYSCPYRCRFCYRNTLNCATYVTREIADVVDEIKEIESENIYLVDDDFLYDAKRVAEFVALIKAQGIHKKYLCYGRADFVTAHPDLMRQLKEIGFYYILVGLEFVEGDRLQTYHKDTDLDKNRACVTLLHEIGIHTMGMFIITPDFKKQDFKSLYQWVKENELKHTAISLFVPEFGLPTYREYEDRIITDNPSHWDYLHVVVRPQYMGVKRFYFYYYCLLIRLFFKAWREGVYDFIDYGSYIRAFITQIFRKRRRDEQ